MKKGDVVVCVDNRIPGFDKLTYPLVVGKSYSVEEIREDALQGTFYKVFNMYNVLSSYNYDYFITVQENRENKLKKLGI
jgi:hypothetical protein